MDAVGLEILVREIAADQTVMMDAVSKAEARLRERAPGFLEATAFELGRHYNVLERVLERVCDAFESHLLIRASSYRLLRHVR